MEKWKAAHVGDDAELSDRVEDAVPDTDVGDALRHRAAIAREELLSVKPHLQHVVDQREQRRQREGRHEDRHEPVLQHWTQFKQLAHAADVRSTAHQTIHFRLCASLISRALALISKYKFTARRAVDRTSAKQPEGSHRRITGELWRFSTVLIVKL
jgi:hypothetical protein